jgi:hypothetical protein
VSESALPGSRVTIIAARFTTFDEAETIVHELRSTGIAQDSLMTFFVNPPGQHDTFPVGGDENADPGAKEAHKGGAKGAAGGASAGVGLGLAAAAAGAGPAGLAAAAAVGVYTGSLAGALGDLGDQNAHRRAGVMLAVRAEDQGPRQRVIEILRNGGAQEIEQAEGHWQNGQWVDFDPLAVPRLIFPPARQPDESP